MLGLKNRSGGTPSTRFGLIALTETVEKDGGISRVILPVCEDISLSKNEAKAQCIHPCTSYTHGVHEDGHHSYVSQLRLS